MLSGSASINTFISSSEGLRGIIANGFGCFGNGIISAIHQFFCLLHPQFFHIFGKILLKSLFKQTGEIDFGNTETICNG